MGKLVAKASRAFEYRPEKAREQNPQFPINPSTSAFGLQNAILTGRSRHYFVPDFSGPLSIKATLQGTSTWTVNRRDFRVSESAFLIVNAEQPYTISLDEVDNVTTFCIFFQKGFVEKLMTAMRLPVRASLDDPFRAGSKEFRLGLQPGPNEVLVRLRKFAKAIASEQISSEQWEWHFQELALALLKSTHSVPGAPEDVRALKASTRQELFQRASVGKDFLISMSDHPIKVEDAAHAACLSTFHFHRTFVQAFGLTPHRFLRNFRFFRAEQLLRSTDVPVIEIAQRVGFISVGSFVTAFGKTYGVAPNSYRLVNHRSNTWAAAEPGNSPD
jgi:AraC-like DNA-binding protein